MGMKIWQSLYDICPVCRTGVRITKSYTEQRGFCIPVHILCCEKGHKYPLSDDREIIMEGHNVYIRKKEFIT